MKQIIVMRKDLNMRAGKMVAQGAHASLAVVLENPDSEAIKKWLEGRFTKICVQVNSEEELFDVVESAKQAGLHTRVIKDAGLTEFNGVATNTCAAIGPASDAELKPITGHLKLL